MSKKLKFGSCVTEFTALYPSMGNSQYHYIYVDTPTNIANTVSNYYKDDPILAGKVTGLGYGWQKYVVEQSGKVKMSVRGAAGGLTTYTSSVKMDTITGTFSPASYCIRGGRGAKLEAEVKLSKGDILYILVGLRGWCNYANTDYGGGGGGASVVLRENTSGTHNFTIPNVGTKKVDILMVAGGGGGCFDQTSSPNANHHGKDAVITNGTNTNGGTSSSARGGAGMTGNGSSGSGGNASPSILSGNPSYTGTSQWGTYHQGGWGGGGGSYDGGGGGGGYSGGAATSNSYGGNGGTSYINPTYCTEVFRGYATVAEDSERNLWNPWTAYGFVEIELMRDNNKLILAKDEDGVKWFNGTDDLDGNVKSGATNLWELTSDQSNPPLEQTFKDFGNTIITGADGLGKDVTFYINSTEENESLTISANVNGTTVAMNKDVKLSEVSEFLSCAFTGNLTDTNVKFAISTNHGTSWKTYNGGIWQNVDINNREDFQTNGFDLSLISTIPMTDWKGLSAKTIRFAFNITQIGSKSGQFKLSDVFFTVNQTGSWSHSKESDYDYSYVSDDQIKITFNTSGSYKVNYLDKIIKNDSE